MTELSKSIDTLGNMGWPKLAEKLMKLQPVDGPLESRIDAIRACRDVLETASIAIQETAPDRYLAFWRVSGSVGRELDRATIDALGFPEGCEEAAE